MHSIPVNWEICTGVIVRNGMVWIVVTSRWLIVSVKHTAQPVIDFPPNSRGEFSDQWKHSENGKDWVTDNYYPKVSQPLHTSEIANQVKVRDAYKYKKIFYLMTDVSSSWQMSTLFKTLLVTSRYN